MRRTPMEHLSFRVHRRQQAASITRRYCLGITTRTSSIRTSISTCEQPTGFRRNFSSPMRMKKCPSSVPAFRGSRHCALFGTGTYPYRRRMRSRLAGQSEAGGTLTDQDVGISRFSDPEERILPNIQVLGAFQLGNSFNDQGRPTNNNFYVSNVLSLSQVDTNSGPAWRSFAISSTRESTTQRVARRSCRSPIFCSAFLPGPLQAEAMTLRIQIST